MASHQFLPLSRSGGTETELAERAREQSGDPALLVLVGGLARLPDDGGHLVGVEGPHRVRADVAGRPDLKQNRRRCFIVGA